LQESGKANVTAKLRIKESGPTHKNPSLEDSKPVQTRNEKLMDDYLENII
jgi:hypothetical protein